MSGTEPIGSIDFTALMLATEACAVGDCLLYDSAEGYWRVATTAHRESADVGTQAIARTAYGGSEVGKVKYQTSGVVPQSVSGLAVLSPSNTKKLVRTSSTGRLERIDSYTSGDDIVGYATWDGRVALHLGLPWESIATFAGVAPGGNTNSVQYKVNSTTLGGADHVSISGGYLELAADRTGGAATTGDLRLAKNGTMYARDVAGTGDVHLLGHAASGSDDYVLLGTDASFANGPEAIRVASTEQLLELIVTAGPTVHVHRAMIGPGAYPAAPDAKVVIEGPSLVIGPYALVGDADPVNGAAGLLHIRTSGQTNPSAAPTFGAYLRPNASTYLWEYLIPGADPDTGWVTLGGGSSGSIVNVTSTTPGDVAVTGNDTVNCNASGAMSITGFTAPAAGVQRTIHVTNNSSDDVDIQYDNASTAANGVVFYTGSGLLTIPQYSAVTLSYDHNKARYVAHLGATAAGA